MSLLGRDFFVKVGESHTLANGRVCENLQPVFNGSKPLNRQWCCSTCGVVLIGTPTYKVVKGVGRNVSRRIVSGWNFPRSRISTVLSMRGEERCDDEPDEKEEE